MTFAEHRFARAAARLTCRDNTFCYNSTQYYNREICHAWKKTFSDFRNIAYFLTACSSDAIEAMKDDYVESYEPFTAEDIAEDDSAPGEESAENTACETAEVDSNAAETAEAEILPLTSKTYASAELNEQYMKLIGRTHNQDGILWLPHSASGIEFTMSGTFCSVTVAGDNMAGSESSARIAAYVNGERVLDEMVSESEMTFEIFRAEDGLEINVQDTTLTGEEDFEQISYIEIIPAEEPQEVTITILKLSEALQSTVGIKSIDVVSSGDISPTAEKPLKIEFIGDSLTCGYGVDDEDYSHHFSTATEDATKAYAYKTAQLLDADYSIVSYSGYGIVSGYTSTEGVKAGAYQVPDMYEMLGYSCGSYNGYRIYDTEWDFTRFQPDVVVINLGANDFTYTGDSEELVQEYVDAYVEFLKKVREYNPNAYIVCCLGLVSDGLFDAVCSAVECFMDETGDTRAAALHFPIQDGTTGYAADWHPTAAAYDIAAELLAGKIREVLGS